MVSIDWSSGNKIPRDYRGCGGGTDIHGGITSSSNVEDEETRVTMVILFRVTSTPSYPSVPLPVQKPYVVGVNGHWHVGCVIQNRKRNINSSVFVAIEVTPQREDLSYV